MLAHLEIRPETAKLYGLSSPELVEYLSPYHLGYHRFWLEQNTAIAFNAMAEKAEDVGIKLAICSAHRPFDRQLAIWNAKACGQRVLLDANELPLNIQGLSDGAIVDSILLWSALPGTSRHHWGTDLDVFDAAQINVKALRLVKAEYDQGGPCAKLHAWLVDNAYDFGFYFPFQQGQSAVSPEPWHISYFPVAQLLLPQFDRTELAILLENSDMLLKNTVLPRLDSLIDEYVLRIAQP
ncbi:MAG: M15 family metallopeptidase [Shewanella sp.]